ncbi:hypothetical protein BD779DRAFT_1672815 [Infundibulicybe gibba]|nr:hypothetical protein BD779DRAFT_1672815 [Infundibulicybe gibba]
MIKLRRRAEHAYIHARQARPGDTAAGDLPTGGATQSSASTTSAPAPSRTVTSDAPASPSTTRSNPPDTSSSTSTTVTSATTPTTSITSSTTAAAATTSSTTSPTIGTSTTVQEQAPPPPQGGAANSIIQQSTVTRTNIAQSASASISSSATSTPPPSGDSPVGTIVGALAGAILGIAVISVIVGFILRRWRKRRRDRESINFGTDDFRKSAMMLGGDPFSPSNPRPPSMVERRLPKGPASPFTPGHSPTGSDMGPGHRPVPSVSSGGVHTAAQYTYNPDYGYNHYTHGYGSSTPSLPHSQHPQAHHHDEYDDPNAYQQHQIVQEHRYDAYARDPTMPSEDTQSYISSQSLTGASPLHYSHHEHDHGFAPMGGEEMGTAVHDGSEHLHGGYSPESHLEATQQYVIGDYVEEDPHAPSAGDYADIAAAAGVRAPGDTQEPSEYVAMERGMPEPPNGQNADPYAGM